VRTGAPAACVAPAGAREAFRAPTAVVYERRDAPQQQGMEDEGTARWWTCLVADPVVRPFATYADSDFGYGEGFVAFSAAGSRFAYVHWSGYARSGETPSRLEVADLATDAAPVLVARFARDDAVVRTAVSSGGNVAWIGSYPSSSSLEVHVWHDGVDRVVGSVDLLGAALIDLRVDETTVSWTEGGAPRSAPVVVP
jgi:hypothetical protein